MNVRKLHKHDLNSASCNNGLIVIFWNNKIVSFSICPFDSFECITGISRLFHTFVIIMEYMLKYDYCWCFPMRKTKHFYDINVKWHYHYSFYYRRCLTCVKTELRRVGENGTTCSWKCLVEKISFLKKRCKHTHLHFAFKYITFRV